MIKAIGTFYRGCRFRSRIEARWAVFYDTLGIKWEYEKEGFDLGEAGYYLPDFWIPHLECWIEIKGGYPTNDECHKIFTLSEMTGNMGYIFWGEIPDPGKVTDSGPEDTESAYACGDYHHNWCQCSICGSFGIEFDARAERLSCHRDGTNRYTGDSPKLLQAYLKARSYRFDKGGDHGLRQ